MKKAYKFRMLIAGLVVGVVFLVAPAVAQMEKMLLEKEKKVEAAEKAANEPPPVIEISKTGTISVTRDSDGEVTGIKLIVLSYNVAMDEKAKLLAGLDGKKVKLIGMFEGNLTERDERFFKVKNFEPLETSE